MAPSARRRPLVVLATALASASALAVPKIVPSLRLSFDGPPEVQSPAFAEEVRHKGNVRQSMVSDRRSLLADMLASTAALANVPRNNLLWPVKLALDRAVDLASKLDAEESIGRQRKLLSDLESLLLVSQNFTRGTTPIEVPQRPAQSYLDAYAEYRNKASLLEKPGAMLVQSGEIDAWKRLKRQEKAREDADEIRAALNYYTSNINFDADKFVLTASKEERSKLIREDRIPDVKSVIASDMGLRYLLRNDLLTAVDDARAELRYQMTQSRGNKSGAEVEGKELLELLLAAQGALDKWFGLIDENDREAALALARREK